MALRNKVANRLLCPLTRLGAFILKARRGCCGTEKWGTFSKARSKGSKLYVNGVNQT